MTIVSKCNFEKFDVVDGLCSMLYNRQLEKVNSSSFFKKGGDKLLLFQSIMCRIGRYAMLGAGLLTLLFSLQSLAEGTVKVAIVGIAFGVLALGVCVLSWYRHLCAPKKWCRHNY